MTFQYNNIGLRLLSFFLFFLCGMVPLAEAQAWNPFPVGAPIVYSNYVNYDPMHQTGTTNYFAVRIDSVRQEGNDSAFYHFRIDRPFHEAEYQLNCNGDTVRGWRGIKLNEQHFMGEKMLRSSDGTCRFVFAVNPDTFVLKTFATVGESWTWHGNTVATVTQIRYEDVAGVMDSVKYIQLSDAPDIQLSRRFGFVEVFNFGPFAPCNWYGCAFKLVGRREGENLKKELPFFEDVFDFQAGDVFQYQQVHRMPSTQRDYDLTTEYTFQSGDPGNEFVYGTMMQQHYQALRPDVPDGYRPPMRVTLNFDHLDMAYLDLLPYEHNPAISNSNWAPVQAGASGATTTFRYWTGGYGGYLDTCGQFYVLDDQYLYRRFAAGLGKVTESWKDSVGIWYEAMNCYRKLERSWGDCEVLRTDLFADSTGEMFLYPNPTKETVHVLLNPGDSTEGAYLVIYSATGAKVRMYVINPMNVYFELDVADLRPGLYFVGLEGNGKRRQTKRLVILR
ncbi:MAG: Secretion system C-terminal sorting domain [Bacteroidota bacterium]|jgi:hypothetical protein